MKKTSNNERKRKKDTKPSGKGKSNIFKNSIKKDYRIAWYTTRCDNTPLTARIYDYNGRTIMRGIKNNKLRGTIARK